MDATHSTWHRYHIGNKNAYADGYSDLMSCMKTWRRYNLHHRLVYFAENFKPPQFINQNVLAGFYDTAESDVMKVGVSFKPFIISHPHATLAVLAEQIPEQEER